MFQSTTLQGQAGLSQEPHRTYACTTLTQPLYLHAACLARKESTEDIMDIYTIRKLIILS